ncbi:hypothetical protein PUN28_017107 [Cardiocondyla obscurior]|uniref:Uncharacterized protein n=1 Tax=Cardiocondyla obscurior TaxID=286306 RepID=A0AAW2EKB7_9HYME
MYISYKITHSNIDRRRLLSFARSEPSEKTN